MTKSILTFSAFILISIGNLFSQKESPVERLNKLSGTPPAPQQWDVWFNNEVQKFKNANVAGKSNNTIHHTIPVIFHILHNGEAIGTAPNIAATQIQAQLDELNSVFMGVGSNPSAIVHYSQYIGNPGITFCLALNDPTNMPLGEPGINRIDAGVQYAANTNTIINDNALLSFINTTVIPTVIWDPTKYLNVFISATSPLVNVLGSATYPAGTSLVGLGAVGSATNDAVWVATGTVGNTLTPGSTPNYANGKTLCREIGHWLGLKTIWGDATCGTDYCADTPPATGPNFICANLPTKINSCGTGQSPGGEMTMNIMDYTPDACRFMFTPEQCIRMQTAMSQSPFRSALGTHGLCTTTITTPSGGAFASFSLTSPPCFGQAFTPVNTSTGSPTPTYTWSLLPNTATVISGYNAHMPSFNLSNQGSYTLELVASNTINTSTYTYTFSTVLCPKDPNCLDTLKKIKNTDTLTVYSVNSSTSVVGCNVVNPGFLTGTNCYNDKEFSQYFAGNSYSDTPVPQLSSVYVLFNKSGTKSNATGTSVYCNVWGGTFNGGPVTLLKQNPELLSTITTTALSTWSTVTTPTDVIEWVGTPTYTFSSLTVIPHKFVFNPPLTLPTSGFHVGVEMPWTSPADSAQIFSNTIYNAPIADSSVFVRTATNTWYKLFKIRNKNIQLAILPEITCKAPVGINEYKNELDANIILMPNPNNGVFSILTTLNKEQDLTFKIYNYLGSVIGTNKETNVTKGAFEINMSNNANGVYFVEINNGAQKTVKKVVINK